MTNTTLPDEVLKSDVLGRVRTPRTRQEVVLDEFERSGMSGTKFAALIGVKYQTFASWVQRRRHARGKYPLRAKSVSGEPVRLLEAVVEGASGTSVLGVPLCVELPGGARVEVRDGRQAALAAELLRALAARPC